MRHRPGAGPRVAPARHPASAAPRSPGLNDAPSPTHEASWQRVIEETQRELGGLDVLVNNAGIVVLATIEETTLEQCKAVQAVNADGVFRGCKHAIPAGCPEDVAELVLYLASDAARLVNGAEISIDAGLTAGASGPGA